LTFSDKKEIKDALKALKEKHGNDVTITPARENLEEFFFRKIEAERSKTK
jgi:hypothetical protein